MGGGFRVILGFPDIVASCVNFGGFRGLEV